MTECRSGRLTQQQPGDSPTDARAPVASEALVSPPYVSLKFALDRHRFGQPMLEPFGVCTHG
jgi:hypothetical protein